MKEKIIKIKFTQARRDEQARREYYFNNKDRLETEMTY